MKNKITDTFRMDKTVSALYEEFNRHLRKNRSRLAGEIEQFKAAAAENHVRYAGMPLAIGFYPVILTEGQMRYISSVAKAMIRLMNKATALFLREPAVKELFGFSPERIELIEVDPGYKHAIPCARFDSFFNGTSIRFTEVNTDGTAGMDGAEKVAKLFLASPVIEDFFSRYPVTAFDISRSVLQTLLDCYARFAGSQAAGKPLIAIVDWKEARTSAEFVAFAEYCRAQGYDAVVADPRELEYDGRALTHRGSKVDVIYRRVVSSEYIERLDEVKAMTQAFTDRNVCLVGSFRSDVAFSKKVFALMHKPELKKFFTADELKLAQEHVPWTQHFEDSACDYRGTTIAMPELARKEKDSFVLKPSYLYEGRGVFLGFQKTLSEWETAIETALKEGYVLQELLLEPSLPIGEFTEGFELQSRYIHLGEFVFGGTFSGFYCRAAEGPLIDRTSREQLLPCLVLGK